MSAFIIKPFCRVLMVSIRAHQRHPIAHERVLGVWCAVLQAVLGDGCCGAVGACLPWGFCPPQRGGSWARLSREVDRDVALDAGSTTGPLPGRNSRSREPSVARRRYLPLAPGLAARGVNEVRPAGEVPSRHRHPSPGLPIVRGSGTGKETARGYVPERLPYSPLGTILGLRQES
jgi:hypothetical protein